MGVLLTNSQNKLNSWISSRIGKARSALYAARGIGSQLIPCDPKVISRLYWSVIIPQLTYGLDVLPLNESNLSNLEESHRQNRKIERTLGNMFLQIFSHNTISYILLNNNDSWEITMVKEVFCNKHRCET